MNMLKKKSPKKTFLAYAVLLCRLWKMTLVIDKTRTVSIMSVTKKCVISQNSTEFTIHGNTSPIPKYIYVVCFVIFGELFFYVLFFSSILFKDIYFKY